MSYSSSRIPGASIRNRTGGKAARSGWQMKVSMAPSLVGMSRVFSIMPLPAPPALRACQHLSRLRSTTKHGSQAMAHASNVYAGVAGYFGNKESTGKVGVFRRAADNGDWQHVLGTVQAFTVFVHPKDPETVFAGTNDGVWRSTDRGATFRRTNFPEAKKEVWCFMVDSRDAKRIFAGASPIDLYRSDDGGASWRKLPTPSIATHCKGPFASRVMRLAQHPTRPDEIYAALEINGVMRSTDGGETWQDCSAGLIKLAELPHLKSKIVND